MIRTVLFATVLTVPAAALAQGHIIESHGISAFGELKYPADFPHFDYVNPDAPKGGTMSFRGQFASRTFDSLNAFILQGEPAQGLERLYDTLMVRAFDEPDAVYGQIAERIEYPGDRSWVIFYMRPEARFTDGHPITAEDVVFTIETLKSEGHPYYKITLKDIESATAIDPTTVRVEFTEGVQTRDLIMEVGQIEILPAHYYAEVDFATSTMEPPVGSGAYVVENADPGRSITYCRVEDYWGADLPVNAGTENFDCFRYEYFGDNTAAFEALKVGEYLFHEEFTSAIWATAYDFPSLEKGWVKQEVLDDKRSAGAQGFWLNMRRERLQDPRVREAIGYLFNFEWSNQTLFYELYARTDSFWENTDLQATGMPEGAELELLERFRGQIPNAVFDQPAYVPPVSRPSPTDRAIVRRASALLDAAGWTVGDDGLRRNADGQLLTIEFVDDSPSFERIVLPFIENLRQAGIDARYDQIDSAQMEQRQEDFDFDIVVARLVLPMTPSVELQTLFGSQSVDQPGTLNLAGVADPAVDGLIEEVIGAASREEMTIAVRALDRVLRAKHIWAPNWFKGEHWIAYWDVFGRPEIKPPFVRGDDYWWWDQAKYEALRAQGALD